MRPPRRALLATADQGGNVRVFAQWSGLQVAALPGHKAPVRAAAWLLAGTLIFETLVIGSQAARGVRRFFDSADQILHNVVQMKRKA